MRNIINTLLEEIEKPFRLPKGDSKKFGVYVKNPKTGNTNLVKFGDPDMEIRRDNDKARASFRARHNCDEKEKKADKTKAGYWSCRFWDDDVSVGDILSGKKSHKP